MKLLTKKRLTSNPKRLNGKKLKLAILTLLVFPFQISNATAVTPICATTFTVVQEIIKGKVLDEKGNSLSGVNVSVKGSNEKTQTGFDGSFTIQTPNNNSVLVFSYLGMETREIIASFSPMSIVLRENTKLLDDVVMVGYTSQKSNKISGAVATIKAAKLRDVTEGDVGKMLQGKISGVTVTNNSGDPGEQPIIRIRGTGSIAAGSNPLYVVDGVIGGIPNPSDVESITILKDAASTTLYGARAANGVIVITTKRGKSGKTTFDFRTTSGTSQLDNGKFKLMNSEQLYNTYARALENAGNSPADIEAVYPSSQKNVNTNWQDLAFRTGTNTNHELNISGGNDKTRFYLGTNYYKEDGIVIGTGINRYSFRLNLDHNVSDKFKISANIASTITKKDNNTEGALDQSYTNLPYDRAIDEFGNPINPNTAAIWYGRDVSNFVFERQFNYNKSNDTALEGLLKGEYSFTKALTLSSTNRAEYGRGSNASYSDSRSTTGSYTNGYLYNYNSLNTTYLTSNILKYNKEIGNHQLQILLGQEYNLDQTEYSEVSKIGFLPGLDVLSAGSKVLNASGDRKEDIYDSYFSQANYNFSEKYFMTASFRRDGSSRFGTDNQYANFYAVGGSWILSKEAFLAESKYISNLKLRASYGTTGNAQIASTFGGIDYYSVNSSYNDEPGSVLYQIGNRNLTWEKSKTLDIGLDLSLFKDRVTLTTDYYDRNTTDLLFYLPQLAHVGVASIPKNVGGVNNKGLEFGLNTKNLDGAFKWTTDFNIAFNKNKVTALYDDLPFVDSEGQRLLVGESLNTFFMRKWVGVDPANGDPLWEKDVVNSVTGQTEVTTTNLYKDATRKVVGHAAPDFTGGLRNGFSYKGIELNALMNFVYGNDVYNGDRTLFDNDGAYDTYNMMQLQEGWNRWEQPGDIATHPKLVAGGNKSSQRGSSRFIEDGSYLRLRNVTLAYNLPKSLLDKVHFSSIRISLAADNLHTWTKFSGIDPEVRPSGSIGTKYPFSKKFQLGLQLVF